MKRTTSAVWLVFAILLWAGTLAAQTSTCTIGASASITTTGSADFCADQRVLSSGSFSGSWCSVATAITLLSFKATPSSSAVVLAWETGAETTNAGFRLLRSTQETSAYARIGSGLIPAQGSPALGASYSYTDSGVSAGTTYFYKLEDVDTKGKRTLYGPVSAHVASTALTLVSPADGTSFPSDAPSFEWTADGLASFRVQFSTVPTFTKKVLTLPAGWLKATHFTPTHAQWRAITNLAKGASTVYWRVTGTKAGSKTVLSDPHTLQSGISAAHLGD